MLSTLNGIPILYDLVPASTDERLAGQAVLPHLYGCELLADKGFIGEEWQTLVAAPTYPHVQPKTIQPKAAALSDF